MRRMLRPLRAHKPARLVFAILTLSIALAGVVANYSLTHNATRAFQGQLDLSGRSVFLIGGTLNDARRATRGVADGASIEAHLGATLPSILPRDMRLFVLGTAQAELRGTGPEPARGSAAPQSVTLFRAPPGFLDSIAAHPAPDAAWGGSADTCLLGQSLAQRLGSGRGETLWLGGRTCNVAGVVAVPPTPPFPTLDDAVMMAGPIDGFARTPRAGWSVYLSGPAGSLSEETLRTRLGAVLDPGFVQIWSGADLAARAERLVSILGLVANGLGLVILLVGAASIASLMSFSVAERAREIAVKRTIGATRAQIVVEILVEALLIGLVSAVIGAVAGYHLANWLQAPLGEFLAVGLAEGESLSPWPILKAAVGFLAICAAAGLVPALRAASRDPAAILRAA